MSMAAASRAVAGKVAHRKRPAPEGAGRGRGFQRGGRLRYFTVMSVPNIRSSECGLNATLSEMP